MLSLTVFSNPLRIIAGSVSVTALTICYVLFHISVSGSGCCDRKKRGSASSLPGSYFNSKSTSDISITHFSICAQGKSCCSLVE